MVYLTCTKNRSFQRKHVEVCQRCSSNDRCKTYQDYCRNLAAENHVQPETEVDRERLLSHIIHELHAIRQLTYHGQKKPALRLQHHRKPTIKQPMGPHDILAVLQDIRTLCKRSHST